MRLLAALWILALTAPEIPVGEPDDLVSVEGLVYEFFVEDDSKDKQLGVESKERDYLIAPGDNAEALAKLLGETVRVKGWLVIDANDDAWLRVHDFEAKIEAM